MNTKLIVTDLDNILIDLYGSWLSWYREQSGHNLTSNDMRSYHVHHFVLPEWKERIYDFFKDPNLYKETQPLAGAERAMRTLHEFGYDIVIATATVGTLANDKFDLIAKVAPFLKTSNVLIGARKELIRSDFFIDDAPKNIIQYRNAWPKSKILTIAWPYNRDCSSIVDLYARDHENTYQAWSDIVEFIIRH